MSFVDFNYLPTRIWLSFSKRRLNEGEPANGLSAIQSEGKQLACDGYWGNINLTVLESRG